MNLFSVLFAIHKHVQPVLWVTVMYYHISTSNYCNLPTYNPSLSHKMFAQKSEKEWKRWRMKAECCGIKMLEHHAILNELVWDVWVTVLHTGAIWCRVISVWAKKSRVKYGKAARDGLREGQMEIRQTNWEAVCVILSLCLHQSLFIHLSICLTRSHPSISLSLPFLTHFNTHILRH